MKPLRSSVFGSIAGAAGMIALITLASRALGFVRWMVQSWMLHGGSPTAGGYAAANQIPNVLFEIAAGGALAGVVVPLIAAPLAKAMRGDVNQVASALLTWTLSALLPLALLVYLFATPIAQLLPTPADAFSYEAALQVTYMAGLLKIFAWQIPLYGISIVLSGVLQAHRAFFWPAFAPLLSSLVVIGSYLWFGQLAGPDASEPAVLSNAALAVLGWGTTAGVAALSLPLFLPAWKVGVRLHPTWKFPTGAARRASKLAGAGLSVLLAQQVSVLAVLWLAPFGGDAGTLSLWQLAQAVYLLPYAIGVVPIVTATYPAIAAAVAQHDTTGWQALIARSTRLVVAVAAGGVGVVIAVAPTIPLLFRADANLAPAVLALAPALPGLALVYHFTRILYALDKAGKAVIAGTIGWGLVAVSALAFVLATTGGERANVHATLVSFGLAHAFGLTIAALMLAVFVRRCAGALAYVGVGRGVVVTVAAAALGGWMGRMSVDALLTHTLMSALLAATAGALCVLIIVALAMFGADRSAMAVIRK